MRKLLCVVSPIPALARRDVHRCSLAGDELRVAFRCTDDILELNALPSTRSLDGAVTAAGGGEALLTACELDEECVLRANWTELWAWYAAALRSKCAPAVLDLCKGWPVTPLLSLQQGASHVDVCGVTRAHVLASLLSPLLPHADRVRLFLRHDGDKGGLPDAAFQSFPSGHAFSIVQPGGPQWDRVVLDVVECTGALQHTLLYDVLFAAQFLLKPRSAATGCSRFVPAGLRLVLRPIHSTALSALWHVPPTPVFGLNMAPLNEFGVRTFEDIHLATLPHTPLCADTPVPAVMFEDVAASMSVASVRVQHTVVLPVTTPGILNAFVYYVELLSDDGGTCPPFSTLAAGSGRSSPCHQAGVLLPQDFAVALGQTITATVTIDCGQCIVDVVQVE